MLALESSVPENGFPPMKFHKTCRSMFPMRDLDRLVIASLVLINLTQNWY